MLEFNVEAMESVLGRCKYSPVCLRSSRSWGLNRPRTWNEKEVSAAPKESGCGRLDPCELTQEQPNATSQRTTANRFRTTLHTLRVCNVETDCSFPNRHSMLHQRMGFSGPYRHVSPLPKLSWTVERRVCKHIQILYSELCQQRHSSSFQKDLHPRTSLRLTVLLLLELSAR
jgi:hypothetical protein